MQNTIRSAGCWHMLLSVCSLFCKEIRIVREPAVGLIMWLRPKGLKVHSYIEKYAEFKNQSLKIIVWYTKLLCATEYKF